MSNSGVSINPGTYSSERIEDDLFSKVPTNLTFASTEYTKVKQSYLWTLLINCIIKIIYTVPTYKCDSCFRQNIVQHGWH